jgi:hypothetical protein
MAYELSPWTLEPVEIKRLKAGAAPERMVVKALPMLVPETVFEHDAEKKRIKKGILGSSEERRVFQKTLYLPYLDFTYQYSAEKGFLSKQTIIGHGRSVMMALREVELGFNPELAVLAPQLIDIESESDSVVQGIESTVLVGERLEELKKMLADYDDQLRGLSKQYDSLLKTDIAKQALKESIENLRKTRETRWKMFADGLKLPSKMDLGKLELLEGNLFYMPFHIVRFSRGGESRFLVWDREGRENETIADELAKNGKFRELIQSHAMSRDDE